MGDESSSCRGRGEVFDDGPTMVKKKRGCRGSSGGGECGATRRRGVEEILPAGAVN